MLFNSLQFPIFFAVFLLVYFSTDYKWRWLVILMASYYFYSCWHFGYAGILAATTMVDFLCGRLIDRSTGITTRKIFLMLSLVSNLSVLCIFKYYDFFVSGVSQGLLSNFGLQYNPSLLHLLLPAGVSFYTFQSIAYTVNVYRKKVPAEKHLGIFAAYIAFFPQLVAGPIERPEHFLPQFRRPYNFSYDRFCSGLQLMLWGFFKKLVIADRLAIYVNHVFSDPGKFSNFDLVIAVYFFAFQIYCDFSGYTDIARGAARCFGFELTKNFFNPYFATSIVEFWKRWHISLSSWFRDFVYIPLGGNRRSFGRTLFNVAAVFVLSGLWHGANLTFVVWGSLHASYMLVSIVSTKLSNNFHMFQLNQQHKNTPLNALRIVFIFHLTTFAWIYFRANSLLDAQVIVRKVFEFFTTMKFSGFQIFSDFTLSDYWLSLLFITVMMVCEYGFKEGQLSVKFYSLPFTGRWFMYYGLIFSIMFFGVFSASRFIYFQF